MRCEVMTRVSSKLLDRLARFPLASKAFTEQAVATAGEALAAREDLAPGDLDALASRIASACFETILLAEHSPSKGALRDAASAAVTAATTGD